MSRRVGNALAVGNTAILNDLHIDDTLEEDQLLKIGVMERYETRPRQPERSGVKAEDAD